MSQRSLRERALALRKLALATLESAGVVGIDILTAPVSDYRELTWLAPPIYPAVEVNDDIPTLFSGEVLQCGTNVELQQAYDRTLNLYLESPKAALSNDFSYVEEAATVFGLEGSPARAIFSAPAVDSAITGDTIGVEASYTFAMEFVAACVSAGRGYQYRSADDFFVIDDGLRVGIRNGRVLGFEDKFDQDISSYVEAYLSMPRGIGWTSKTFDILDRLQFWLDAAILDRPDLEPLVYLLPNLRACLEPEELYKLERDIFKLTGEVQPMLPDITKPQRLNAQEYFRRVDEAIAIVIDIRIPDADKITQLIDLLVPAVIAEGAFAKNWYSLTNGVITLSKKQHDKLLNNLVKLRDKPLKRYKVKVENGN